MVSFDGNWYIGASAITSAELTILIISPTVGFASRVESAGVLPTSYDLGDGFVMESVSWVISFDGDWDVEVSGVTSAELAIVIIPPAVDLTV